MKENKWWSIEDDVHHKIRKIWNNANWKYIGLGFDDRAFKVYNSQDKKYVAIAFYISKRSYVAYSVIDFELNTLEIGVRLRNRINKTIDLLEANNE